MTDEDRLALLDRRYGALNRRIDRLWNTITIAIVFLALAVLCQCVAIVLLARSLS